MTTINIDKKPPFYQDYRVKYGTFAVLIIGLGLLYVLEFRWFNLTIDLQKLVVRSLLIGSVVGLFFGYHYQRFATDLTENIQLYVFFLVLAWIFSPLLGSMTNRLLAFGEGRVETTTIYHVEARHTSSYGLLKGEKITANQWRISLETTEGLLEINSKNTVLNDAKKGDQLLIRLKKGLLGAEFIDLNSLKLVR